MEAQYYPGALFVILGNAARCAPLKIPQNASKDDIRVLFFRIVLSFSTVHTYVSDEPRNRYDILLTYFLFPVPVYKVFSFKV